MSSIADQRAIRLNISLTIPFGVRRCVRDKSRIQSGKASFCLAVYRRPHQGRVLRKEEGLADESDESTCWLWALTDLTDRSIDSDSKGFQGANCVVSYKASSLFVRNPDYDSTLSSVN